MTDTYPMDDAATARYDDAIARLDAVAFPLDSTRRDMLRWLAADIPDQLALVVDDTIRVHQARQADVNRIIREMVAMVPDAGYRIGESFAAGLVAGMPIEGAVRNVR